MATRDQRPRFLFVCSRNEWRSRTAETIFRDDPRLEVRSAGTSRGARIRVSLDQVHWAHTIFVMEDRHRRLLQQSFGREALGERVVVLDIPDEYTYLDEELIAELRAVVDDYLP